MTTKVFELTEKIYREGVEKSKIEADIILEKAKNEASKIIDAAKQNGKKIIEQAKKKAGEIKQNSDSDMQLFSRQAISKLKQQITGLITTSQVKAPVREAFKDGDFVKNIILTLIKNWNPQKPEELNISLLLPQKQERELKRFFENKAKAHLNSGLEISFDDEIKSGFKIVPNGANYYISFTDEDFENYFKNFIKNSTKQFLFKN